MPLFSKKNIFPPIFAILIFVIACVLGLLYKSDDPSRGNLLENHDWSHFPGAKVTDIGIKIASLNRMIIHQDGSVGQPNPPVNLRGPHLEVKGDFQITAKMSNISSGGSFRLYGEAPIVFDEWRFEGPSISFEFKDSKLVANIWDGNALTPMDQRALTLPNDAKLKLKLERRSDQLFFSINDGPNANMPEHDIFSNGNIWFGAEATSTNGWVLNELKATALGKGKLAVVKSPTFNLDRDDPKALRNLASNLQREIKIGAAISIRPLLTDEAYRKIAVSQFSIMTPENSMKPQFIHPKPDVYSFEEADTLIDFAEQNKILVHGHVLVYGKSNPDWMTMSPKSSLEKIMVDHIQNVVTHFQNRVAEWDVVNEAFSDEDADYKNGNNGLRTNTWFEGIGESYIETAFRTARKADPKAVLYLNDYGLEKDSQRWDALIKLVKKLKSRGVPIDGIGFEAHVYKDTDKIDIKVLKRHMQELADLKLKVRISEIDVYGDDPKEQAKQYSDVLKACVEEPNCTSYTTWGITDLYGSTTRHDRYPRVMGNSLIWDIDMEPKEAFSSLQNVLE